MQQLMPCNAIANVFILDVSLVLIGDVVLVDKTKEKGYQKVPEEVSNFKNFKERLTLFIKVYLVLIILGFIIAIYGLISKKSIWEQLGNLMITTTSVATTVIMVYFVALQTKATKDMAEKTSVQVQLTSDMVKQMMQETTIMNETLLEMRKERMNIEYLKNEVIGYIKTIESKLLQEDNQSYVTLPSYPVKDAPKRENYQKKGLKERFKRKIQKLLEEYNINIEKYNSLVRTVNHLRGEVIEALKNEHELMESLQRISQDEAKKFKVKEKHIIPANSLLEELVTLSTTGSDSKPFNPPYGKLGLHPESEIEKAYGREVWKKARQEFYKFLEEKPEIYEVYNKLTERETELKKLTNELLEKIHKMEKELFQSEDELERKLIEL